MAFRRRFQSGTLGRSIKRFGRFPRMGTPFKRKQYTGFVSTLSENSLSLVPVMLSTDLFAQADWAEGATDTVVRNVMIDCRIMVTWSPTTTTVAYDSWYWHWMIMKVNDDETDASMALLASEYPPLAWDAFGRNTGEHPTANGALGQDRFYTARPKFKVPWVRSNEVIRLYASFNASVTETIADARISLVEHVRYELP